MRERFGFGEGMLPASEEASRRMLALPFYPELVEDDQLYVVGELRAAIGGRREVGEIVAPP